MAVAQVVLEVLSEEGFLGDVRARAAYLDDALLGLQGQFPAAISECRGRGFLRGIMLDETIDLGAFVKTLRDDHLLCVPAAENTLRLLPPLTISNDEIDLAVAKIAAVLNEPPKHDSE